MGPKKKTSNQNSYKRNQRWIWKKNCLVLLNQPVGYAETVRQRIRVQLSKVGEQ